MKVITDQAQDAYWQNAGYRAADDPITVAYAVPKLRYIEQFMDLRELRILDVGCGNGAFTRLFAERTPHVVGVDFSHHFLRQNPHGRVLRGRAEQLPFADNSFDVAFVANLLHHTSDPGVVVAELARVANGHVVLLEPNRVNPLMLGFSLLVREERGGLRSSRRFLERLLERSGLGVVRCRAMGMISQNNTPGWLIPTLRRFDREVWWGEYLIAVATKTHQPREDFAGDRAASASL